MSRGVRRDRTPLELGVLIAAVLAIVAIVAGLIAAGLKDLPDRPDLRVTVAPAGSSSGGVAYAVTVHNAGGRTAETVVIEVTVGSEKREAQLLAVARGDEEQATVIFPPGTTGRATAVVLSYSEPAR